MVLYATLGSFAHKHFNNHPNVLLFGVFLLMLSFVAIMYRFADHHQMALVLWLYAVGIGAVLLSRGLRPEKIKQVEWERHFPVLATALLTYATLIYGHIKPSFGGGPPSPVVLYLTAETPISTTDSASVLLLDETDHGYYVLLNPQEKTAYFLRRDLVSAIHFQKKD
jgi:hypothetical protein